MTKSSGARYQYHLIIKTWDFGIEVSIYKRSPNSSTWLEWHSKEVLFEQKNQLKSRDLITAYYTCPSPFAVVYTFLSATSIFLGNLSSTN